MKSQICEQFHREVIDLFIEPDQESADKWACHLKKCEECRLFFEKCKQEQESGQSLVKDLFEYVPSPPKLEMRPAPRLWKKRIPFYVAASILFCFFAFSTYLLVIGNYRTKEQKIATLQHVVFPNLKKEQQNEIQQVLKNYGVAFTRELAGIKNLSKRVENDLSEYFIPFLQKRLILNCRIYLYQLDKGTFDKLENQNFAHVQQVFSRAIDNISINDVSKERISSFFLECLPRLHRIKKQRSLVVKEIKKLDKLYSQNDINRILWKVERIYINTTFKGE